MNLEKKQQILDDLTILFRKELEDETIGLTYDSSPASVGKWDSMSNLLLISAIEEKYNISIPVEFIFSINNVGDICDYLADHSPNSR